MGTVGMLRIIRPLVNAAEKEYIKEFFRFIGCFVSDCPVDEQLSSDWERNLQPANEEKCVDIVLGHKGKDPFKEACRQRGIRRIFLRLTREDEAASPEDRGPMEQGIIAASCKEAVGKLIEEIWAEAPSEQAAVTEIFDLYTENGLFYLLQAKRSLRVLNMAEVLQEPSAKVSHIPLYPYIKRILEGLWKIYTSLEAKEDAHSIYARINAASMIREVACRLYDNDLETAKKIEANGKSLIVFPSNELDRQARKLLDRNPDFVSVYLLMASLCSSDLQLEQMEEAYYLRALKSSPSWQRGYAFIWYRIGQFYEKKCGDVQRALDSYTRAYQANPEYYPALFKLGQYAAVDGRFNEAESKLNVMLQILFHGRSTDPDEHGEYKNWDMLSLKDVQYVYKAYILLAKIAINSNHELSAKKFVGKACLAATKFEEARLVRIISDADPEELRQFLIYQIYHKKSMPVWCMWKVLSSWSEHIVQDLFVRQIVRDRLMRWD